MKGGVTSGNVFSDAWLWCNGLECLKQSGTGILDEVEGMVEVCIRSIIGIGYGGGAAEADVEVCKHPDLQRSVFGAFLPQYVAEILTVHYQYQVETVEIVGRELTCTAVESVATVCPAISHAVVGKFADVPVSDACRVDDEFVGASGTFNEVPHDALCRGAAADVAEADE